MKGVSAAGILGAGGNVQATGNDVSSRFQERPDPERNPRLFADKILFNGTVVTLDEHEMNADPGTIAEGVATVGGEILDVGDDDRVLDWVGPNTEVIDLRGQTVLPGIVESHVHPSGALTDRFGEELAPNGLHMAFQARPTPEATLQAIERYVNAGGPQEDEWIYLNVNPNPEFDLGTNDITLWIKSKQEEDQIITTEDITNIAPDNPMAVSSGGRSPSIAESGQILRLTRNEEGQAQIEELETPNISDLS